jgi:glutamine---fructose-6-phosphate transaminase (isomerizing)
MCGIIGILKNIKNVELNIFDFLLISLTQLQNRGYDSSGICLVNSNKFIIQKYASSDKIDSLEKLKNMKVEVEVEVDNGENANMNVKDIGIHIGIGHNRWATHGPKNDINSHPHISNNGKIVIVHNGIIENFRELKKFLLDKGYKFYSATDTEIIANLLEYYSKLDEDVGGNFMNVIQKTIHVLSGTYGLIILNKDEVNKMYCVRNGSPLLLGYNDEYAMVTSEQSGFCNKVNTYITLQNDIIACISYLDEGVDMEYGESKINITYNNTFEFDLKNVNKIDFQINPEPYEHWTIKEIYEQPQKILNAINLGGRILNKKEVKLGGPEKNVDILMEIENIILLGCGTSYHSCMYAKYFFKKICDFNIINIHDGADFEYSDVPKKGKTLLVFVSQSGETKDLHRCIEIAKENNIFTLGIVNVVDSLIAREVDCGIYCNAGVEKGVASTKAFTTQVICLVLLACWFSQKRGLHEKNRIQIIEDLQNLSVDFQNCLNIVNNQVLKSVEYLESINGMGGGLNNLFILGKDCDESIAREGSLKIKEISYIHSEAYSSSSLKHGPFALLDERMPVILLNNNIVYEAKVLNAYEEIISRKSPIVFITNNRKLNYKNSIYIPANKSFGSLIGIIPLQLIAYYCSIHKGINPDKPKNLAKVVTVE